VTAEIAPPEKAPSPTSIPQWPFLPLSVLETANEGNVWVVVRSSGLPRDSLLCFTRETPSLLTGEYGLSGAAIYRISRVEGEDTVTPGDLEKICSLAERHFAKSSGRAVVLPGLETLVDSSSAKNVARLLEVMRDLAQQSRGAVLVSFDPESLPSNQAAMLRRGAVRLVFSD
jgi:hypothetical protein